MTHRLFGIGAVIAAVILAAGLAIAQSPDGQDQANAQTQRVGPRGGRGGPMAGPGLAALNLTDDQRAKIEEIRRATRDQVAPLEKQIFDLHQQSRDAIAALLTPEQRATFEQMEGRRGGPPRGPGGRGFGRGPRPGGPAQ
jgi:Spy/CpxP family protein refolding chaperone